MWKMEEPCTETFLAPSILLCCRRTSSCLNGHWQPQVFAGVLNIGAIFCNTEIYYFTIAVDAIRCDI